MKSKLFSLPLILLGLNLVHFSADAQKKIHKRSVQDLSLMMNNETLLLPGTTFPIGFQVVMTDGETANTRGFADGKVKWENFEVTVKGGTFNEGNITISEVPQEIASHKLYLSVKTLSSNEFSKDFAIEINYVTELQLSYDGSRGISPGMSMPFSVSAKLNNGVTIATGSPGQLSWNALQLTANGETVRGGVYTLASDPQMYLANRNINVSVTHVSNLEVKADAVLHVDFKSPYVCKMSGADGANGQTGSQGYRGTNGKNGYATTGRTGDGGYGSDGGYGQHGGRGQRGGAGNAVEVYVTADYDPELGTILKVTVLDRVAVEKRYYVVNTSGGSLNVDASGGRGGRGGNGGEGGDGGRGGNAASTTVVNGVTTGGGNGGNGGNGGYGGNGGDGGDGGDGGTIIAYIDPSAMPYLSLLSFSNSGGDPGLGGDGGRGGSGGSGGTGHGRGVSGRSGSSGPRGGNGMRGQSGRPGPQPQITTKTVGLTW